MENMDRMEIISAIESKVMSAKKRDYSIWTIGVTDNPTTTRDEHGQTSSTKEWEHWDTESEDEAMMIKQYFLSKKMKGVDTRGRDSKYVYVF